MRGWKPPPSPPSPRSGPSRWRSFRAFPLLGQIAVWTGVSLSALLGIGFVGAIAAGPTPETNSAAAPVFDTTEQSTTLSPTTTALATTIAATTTPPSTLPATTIPATTVAMTTVPVTTVAQVIPVVVVPPTLADILLTAVVVDGDTITMSDGSTVRLIGIDTPERGQCGYHESSAVLTQLIAGQNITLVAGARDDVDRYGRLLRYVEANGQDVDLQMIESGHAIARYDGRDGYGVHTRQDAYVEADDRTPSINSCAVDPAVPATTPSPAAVYYQNCDAVRAAGADPIRPGDPGWQTKFDRDNDGVGCE
jgi:Excalibur calcium-binding domain/Staphylococcal nuclease homologue